MIVNARMYSATPDAKSAWRALFAWVLRRATLDWEITDYDAPAPLDSLWRRDDLGCVMMCGLPYTQRMPRPTLIAAPVPALPRYEGRAIYFTNIAVRADAPFEKIEETFGGVIGYTVSNSMSGYAALRRYLLGYRTQYGPKLYRDAIGGLLNARQIINALIERKIDVGPVDSYYYDLLKEGDPELAAQVRTIASTPPASIPPLVATAQISMPELGRLRDALSAVGTAPDLSRLRDALKLSKFAFPTPTDYDMFESILDEPGQLAGVW